MEHADAESADLTESAGSLQRAVEVMDRLRSPGGCPWDAAQTHDSLRRYLIEETYELLDAIESGDRAAMLEELGDVLLQVLFHARIAAEHPDEPFDIDDVAAELVDKLVQRHPHVFAGAEVAESAEEQDRRWHELKHQQKRRESIVDGVAMGQPAVALAAKLVQRARRAGVPDDLLPSGDEPGAALFSQVTAALDAGAEPESELRDAAKAFAAKLRAAELAARADGRDPATFSEHDWRHYGD